MKRLLVVMALLMLAVPALAADVTSLDSGRTTDWNIWILSGVLGLVLFLLSLRASGSTAEVELDFILSIMAWVPIGFCAYTANAVSRVVAVGYVTVYSYWIIGWIMWAFLLGAMFNSARLLAAHGLLKGEQQKNRGNLNE